MASSSAFSADHRPATPAARCRGTALRPAVGRPLEGCGTTEASAPARPASSAARAWPGRPKSSATATGASHLLRAGSGAWAATAPTCTARRRAWRTSVGRWRRRQPGPLRLRAVGQRAGKRLAQLLQRLGAVPRRTADQQVSGSGHGSRPPFPSSWLRHRPVSPSPRRPGALGHREARRARLSR